MEDKSNIINPHIILKEDGLYLVDLPFVTDFCKDKCESKSYCLDGCAKYDVAYDQAIKDAVKIKDQEFGFKILYREYGNGDITFSDRLIKNHPYKVSLDVYDVKYRCVSVPCDGKSHNLIVELTSKTKDMTPKQNSAHSFTEGSEVLCPTCGMPRHLPKEYSHSYCSNSFHKPSVTEESQEQLWNKVGALSLGDDTMTTTFNWFPRLMEILKRDFTITRKTK
jgi:hypothetical protein